MHDSAPRVLHFTRSAAVAITVAINSGSFYLSWSALSDLAARVSVSPHAAWVWPLIVDGAILMATMAIVALAPYADQGGARRFFWLVLVGAAAVTVVCNALHAVMFRPAGVNPWLAGAIAVVPPIMLLLSTHGLSLLMRVQVSSYGQDQGGQVDDDERQRPGSEIVALAAAAEPVPVTAAQRGKWVEMAVAIAAQGVAKDASHDDIATVLYLSYERGELSHRAISRHLDMDHRAVGKIVAASAELLRTGQMHIDQAEMVPRRAVAMAR